MKKSILGLAALALLASCNNDEELNSLAPEAINFSNAFVNNATRSIDGSFTATNLPESFLVYGTTKGDEAGAQLVKIFEGINVTKNTSETAWVGDIYKYDNDYTQYWINGNTYNFAALVNAVGANVTLGDDLLPSTVAFVSNDETDLLYATNAFGKYTKGTSATTVAFTFDHLLSKVYFTMTNEIASNTKDVYYQYRVSDVKITNAPKTAVCTVAGKTWADHDNAAEVQFGHVTNATNGADVTDAVAIGNKNADPASATSRYARLLIPGEYNGEADKLSKLNVTCTIETLLNGVVVDVEDYKQNVAVTLEAGTAYNFNLKKGNPGEPIKFTVTSVNAWNDPATPVN